MFSIIFADNSFWRYEHFFFSICAAPLLYFFYLTLKKFDSLPFESAGTYKENKALITFALSHVALQVLYHFVYNFAFLEYLTRLTFIFILVYLNKSYFGYVKTISEEQKAQIEKYLQGFAAFVVFVIFLSILNSRSENSCGQNIYWLYIIIYLCLAAGSFANSHQNLGLVAKDFAEVYEFANSTDPNILTMANSVIENLSSSRVLFYHFIYAVFASCIMGSIVLYFKYTQMGSAVTCHTVFDSKGFFFKVLFSILDFAITNSLNAFILYHYFWKIKEKFEFKENLESRVSKEVFENQRSILIENEKEVLPES